MGKKERIFRTVIISTVIIATLIALVLTIKIEPANRSTDPVSSAASSLITSSILPTESDTAQSKETPASAPMEEENTSSTDSPPPSAVSKASSTVSTAASSRVTASKEASSAQIAAVNSSLSSQQGINSSKPRPKTYTCTVEIRCDTILNNRDALKPEKRPYVPENGVILEKVTVEFTEGETAFDVLKRVVRSYSIQMEHRTDAFFGSVYVEGIGHLYPLDCGDGSGWMFKINGYFPNYGCDSYQMRSGDNMVWCYTCDVGQDVGDQYWNTAREDSHQ